MNVRAYSRITTVFITDQHCVAENHIRASQGKEPPCWFSLVLQGITLLIVPSEMLTFIIIKVLQVCVYFPLAVPQLRRLVIDFSPGRPGSRPGQYMWNFCWTKLNETGSSPKRSIFSCQFNSTFAPYSLISSDGWTKRQLRGTIPDRHSLTPSQQQQKQQQ
jgi:hypothetical protein